MVKPTNRIIAFCTPEILFSLERMFLKEDVANRSESREAF